MMQEPKCPYFDKEYARINEFEYSCSHPDLIKENGDMGNVMSDDLFELCGDCHFYSGDENGRVL